MNDTAAVLILLFRPDAILSSIISRSIARHEDCFREPLIRYLVSYPRRGGALPRHRSSRNRAAASEFQVRIAIGYHELAVPLIRPLLLQSNVDYASINHWIGPISILFPCIPSLLFVHRGEEMEEVGWNGNVNFEEGKFHGTTRHR